MITLTRMGSANRPGRPKKVPTTPIRPPADVVKIIRTEYHKSQVNAVVPVTIGEFLASRIQQSLERDVVTLAESLVAKRLPESRYRTMKTAGQSLANTVQFRVPTQTLRLAQVLSIAFGYPSVHHYIRDILSTK